MRQLLQPVKPSENFVPVLSLKRRLDAFARDLHLSLQQGEDDLDSYDVVLLETDNGEKFLLLHYRGSPDDMVDVYIPSNLLGRRHLINEIVQELRVPRNAVTHLRQEQE